MAKPISFTKRDLEKKKQEKRLAKQQKKEERKSNGTSSFEDMIAYVDENGTILLPLLIINHKKWICPPLKFQLLVELKNR